MNRTELNMIRAIVSEQESWSSHNTEVEKEDGVCRVYLHSNLIAEIGNETIAVSLAGWNTTTTRSRIRCLMAELGGFGSSCWADRGQTWVSWQSDIRPLEVDDVVVFERS